VLIHRDPGRTRGRCAGDVEASADYIRLAHRRHWVSYVKKADAEVPYRRDHRGKTNCCDSVPDPRPSAKLNSEEIAEAIRYLDPDLNDETAQQEDKTALLVCVSAFVLLFYSSVFVWIHHWMR
jgi:hypothetical protein